MIEQDPYLFVQRSVFSRWKPFLLHAIKVDGTTRFSRFVRQLPISEKVLAQNLDELEADGLISRTVYAEVPARVEYRLTGLGESVCPLLESLYAWGWHEMKRRGLPVDPLGEMWHGYREPDDNVMNRPVGKKKRGNGLP